MSPMKLPAASLFLATAILRPALERRLELRGTERIGHTNEPFAGTNPPSVSGCNLPNTLTSSMASRAPSLDQTLTTSLPRTLDLDWGSAAATVCVCTGTDRGSQYMAPASVDAIGSFPSRPASPIRLRPPPLLPPLTRVVVVDSVADADPLSSTGTHSQPASILEFGSGMPFGPTGPDQPGQLS